MTELEKMQRAKMYIDQLANGINPLDNQTLSETDIVNNVKISRCLFYVSDILRQVIENGGIVTKKKTPKCPFAILPSDLQKYKISNVPVTVSEITTQLNLLIDEDTMKKLKATSITTWLVEIGFLEIQTDNNGKNVKRPTDAGMKMGLSTQQRFGMYGDYIVVLYNSEAQRFILDNIDAIIEVNNKS